VNASDHPRDELLRVQISNRVYQLCESARPSLCPLRAFCIGKRKLPRRGLLCIADLLSNENLVHNYVHPHRSLLIALFIV
jgi:hypothetical protein